MPRLTLRTLLAYIDDTLEPEQARSLGQKVAESEEARQLIERIKVITRRRRLTSPVATGPEDDISDPNTVAEYLSDSLEGPHVRELEEICLKSDVHLAEVAACHQILTLVLTEPVRVPPTANQRMYKLVEAPASDPNRRPGKARPIAGLIPPIPHRAETDDPDAALLLGMKPYKSADAGSSRATMFGVAAGLLAMLALAVLMALPHSQPERPETSLPGSVALAEIPKSTDPPIVAPEPRPIGTTPEPGKPPTKTTEDPKVDPLNPKEDPKVEPGPGLGDPVKQPMPGREVIGRLETDKVLVVTRGPEAGATWIRADVGDPGILASDSVMALPGYKAEVRLDTGVTVYLWGNVPQQVPVEVLQSRVVFHPPAAGFDADMTLEAGRVYLTTIRPGGVKVRVRIATETWDLSIPANAEVMAQAVTAFVPGSLYSRNEGELPRTRAKLAVLRGTSNLAVPGRFKKFDALPAWTEITWDSKTGVLSDPKAVPKGDPTISRIVLQVDERGRAIQKALADTTARLAQNDGIRVLLEGRMNALDLPLTTNPTPFQLEVAEYAVQFAIYAYAAIADSTDAVQIVSNLCDQMANTERPFARRAAIAATSGWIGQERANTSVLCNVLTTKKQLPEDEADLIAHLLRGYSSAATGDVVSVDKLVELLNHDLIIVREAALGNLLAFFDPSAFPIPSLGGLNVGLRQRGEEQNYANLLKPWKEHADVIKKKMQNMK